MKRCRLLSHAPATSLLALGLAAACGGGNNNPDDEGDVSDGSDNNGPDAGAPDAAPTTPLLRNPVDLADDQLALEALRLLGADVDGATGTCGDCHGVTQATIRSWSGMTETSAENCLTDLDIGSVASAQAMVACFRNNSDNFSPRKLGVWSTGARLPWFETLFTRAAAGAGTAEYDDFLQRAGMPVGGFGAMTQGEFDIVAEWFVRGIPMLEETLPEGPVGECTPFIDARVGTIVAAAATTGWRARNADANLAMYGCAGAASTLDCMSDQPDAAATGYGANWALGDSVIRVLTQIPAETSYWSRSSADGRFFGSGAGVPGGGSSIIDLTNDHQIQITDAYYDPAFFPDNNGWVFQGSGGNNVCAQSVLLGSPNSFYMDGSASCSALNLVGLYQHVGRATTGGVPGDYFSISGNFSNDDFGHAPTHGQPAAPFNNFENVDLTPMVFNGTTFQQDNSTSIAIPQEGDVVLSETTDLAMSRLSSGAGSYQIGFQMRAIDKTGNVDGTYDVDAPIIGTYCQTGGKVAFSFDDRWAVYHHYYENTDADAQLLGFANAAAAGFAPYKTKGASDIFAIELTTGLVTRITNMTPGQYAQYPHFRSDGWLYFLVRDNNSGKEYAAASDRVLRLE